MRLKTKALLVPPNKSVFLSGFNILLNLKE